MRSGSSWRACRRHPMRKPPGDRSSRSAILQGRVPCRTSQRMSTPTRAERGRCSPGSGTIVSMDNGLSSEEETIALRVVTGSLTGTHLTTRSRHDRRDFLSMWPCGIHPVRRDRTDGRARPGRRLFHMIAKDDGSGYSRAEQPALIQITRTAIFQSRWMPVVLRCSDPQEEETDHGRGRISRQRRVGPRRPH